MNIWTVFILAIKNLLNAGLRTWLNVFVLSFVFVVVLFYKGFLDGWTLGSERNSIAWEFAQGQLQHPDYQFNNTLTLQDAHGTVPHYREQELTPVLIQQAALYPQGRQLNILLKGIDPQQNKVNIPTPLFARSNAAIPALIGRRMEKTTQLTIGERVPIRWRDKNGTFDAGYITVVGTFDSSVPSIDQGQIWIPIDTLWHITGLTDEATFYLVGSPPRELGKTAWHYKSQDDLLQEIRELISAQSVSGTILYSILLAIALLAIFDTQVLSIFRRKREIGTCVALGMTRKQVMLIFTLEGTMYSFFSMIIGSIVGIPLLLYFSKVGIYLGRAADDMGMPSSETVYPVFTVPTLLNTAILIVILTTIVSFLPARKIAQMNPILALKGREH